MPALQGFASGDLDQDAAAVRMFVQAGQCQCAIRLNKIISFCFSYVLFFSTIFFMLLLQYTFSNVTNSLFCVLMFMSDFWFFIIKRSNL
jgi:hypothetical protein